jgi:hypothetical protein
MNLQPSVHPLYQTFVHIHQLSPYIAARLGTPTAAGWLTPVAMFAADSPLSHLY